MVTLKNNAFFLMGSHVRIPVPLVFIFVWARGAFKQIIPVTMHMSVEVPFVLKTLTTSFVFAHVTEFCLVCNLMLLQSAFEWEALTAVFTNKMKITVKVHMLVKRRLCCKFFCHIAHNKLSRGPSCDVHLVL